VSVEPVAVTIGTEILNGLSAIGAHEDAIGGAALAAGAAIKGTSWLYSALKTRLPFLDRHYLGTSSAAQTQGAANVLNVSQHIRKRFDEYVSDGRLTERQAHDALDNPAFALFFNDAVLGASETDDDFIHEQFASLIIERMTNDHASVQAIAIRLATERLRDITSRQLKLLGALYVTQYGGLSEYTGDTIEKYAESCSAELRPHWNVRVVSEDIASLASLNVIKIREHSTKYSDDELVNCPMLLIAAKMYPRVYHPFEAFIRLRSWMEGKRIEGDPIEGTENDEGDFDEDSRIDFVRVVLTQSGWTIGHAVHSHLLDRRLDFSAMLGEF
jgi:hypothetical protein